MTLAELNGMNSPNAVDALKPCCGSRRWAEEMKKLAMTYEYIEVAGGGHVNVAMQNMPQIFAFFDKHRKKAK